MNSLLDLYRNIRSRRIELGMSQQKLADILGYTDRSSIAKVEAGLIDLSESKILKFADALRVSASDLMGFPETKEESPNPIKASPETVAKFSPLLEQLSPDELAKVYEYATILLQADKYQKQKGENEHLE